MKTILICIPTLASAGAQRFVTELACSIDKTKYRAVVVVTNYLDNNSAFYKKLLSNEIEVVDVSASNYLKETRKIIDVIKKYQPIIIHSNVGAYLHVLLAQLVCGRKISHLFTVHSMAYRIFSGVKKKIVRFCFKRHIVVPVAICDTVKQSIVESYGLQETDIECIYNGVDTDLFVPEKDRKERPFTFVTVGTLYHIKNHELIINAFSLLKKHHADVCLRIVGDGELRQGLEKQVQDLQLMDSVIFEGNQADVYRFLNLSDVYCCTSKVEGLPIAVLEAMACGLPVITTPAGGVVDIVKDGENGFVVESNEKDFATAMNKLYTNPDMQKRMSTDSREKALLRDQKICTSEYEKLYEKYSRK